MCYSKTDWFEALHYALLAIRMLPTFHEMSPSTALTGAEFAVPIPASEGQSLNIQTVVEPIVKQKEFPQFQSIDYNDPGKGIDLAITIGGTCLHKLLFENKTRAIAKHYPCAIACVYPVVHA